MALTPQNNDAFFREVDEDLRRDRMLGFVRRWGRTIGLAVGLFLIALAGVLWWQSYREGQAGQDSERLSVPLSAISGGQALPDTQAIEEVAQSPRAGYSAAARLTLAALAQQKGDAAAAAAAYQAIADDTKVAREYRDLALIRATAVRFDTLPPQQVIDTLKGLVVTGNPWFPSAAELTAGAWAKLGRRDKAGALFAAIARDPAAPGSLRGRAAAMATSYGQTLPPLAGAATLKD